MSPILAALQASLGAQPPGEDQYPQFPVMPRWSGQGQAPPPGSGPQGYHQVQDIMELRGGTPSVVSGYGVGQPSNTQLYQQKVQQWMANQQALQGRAAMMDANARMSLANTEAQKVGPDYINKMAAMEVAKDPNAPPEQKAQAFKALGFGPTPGQVLTNITGRPAPQPGVRTPIDTIAGSALARQPGGYAADSPEAGAILEANPEETAARLQGEPLHWYERELTGDASGQGAMNIGDVLQGGLPWAVRNWVNPMFHPQGEVAPTHRQLAERKVGALLPQGVGKQKPGARVLAQTPEALNKGVAERQAERQAREARVSQLPSWSKFLMTSGLPQ